MKIYNDDPDDQFSNIKFLSRDLYQEYLLQIHLYMGKDFPPADDTGAADPFVIARCQGKVAKSETKFETLNPGFFEVMQMKISLPPLEDPNVRYYIFWNNFCDIVPNSRAFTPCL